MKNSTWAFIGSFFLAAAMSASAWSQNAPNGPAAHTARPGSINYVEGQASVGNQELGADSVGSAEVAAGQTLTTGNGKAEVLLTPGVILRVDDNSAVKMISPDLANTEVEVDKGRAMVEVADIHKENNIRIDENGVSTKLLKTGIYDFDADHSQVRVFKGKAQVYGSRKLMVTGDHQVTLTSGAKLNAKEFDSRQYEDAFYRWCGLRSGYLSEANADEARDYVNGGAGWSGSGWYWSPGFEAYTFVPGDGIFDSPFGWDYYSPFALYGSPFFYGGGFYGGPHRFSDFHGPYGHGNVGAFRGGRGGVGGGFHGGGFHGGGGGFHGGGGGGGHR